MAEYKSFHYLMHKPPEHAKAFYVEGPKALNFAELYSPRMEQQHTMISKSEKSYWRTRDRIEFTMYEDRKGQVMIITCWSVEAKESFRTIFVDLERLYHEVESKARGSRVLLTKKKDKKLSDDADVRKAAAEFLLARLNIKHEPMPWPAFVADEAMAAAAAVTDGTDAALNAPPEHMERMCTLDRMTNDEYVYLEIPCPFAVTPDAPPPPELATIERLKLCSSAAALSVTVASTASVPSAPAVTEATSAISPTTLPTSAAQAAIPPSSATVMATATGTATADKGRGVIAIDVRGTAQLDSPVNSPAKMKGKPTAAAVSVPATVAKKGGKKVAPSAS